MSKLNTYLEKHNLSPWIAAILAIALLSRLALMIHWGSGYMIDNDDTAYIFSGIHFMRTGEITLRGALTAQITPGMPLIIAAAAAIFGTGKAMMLALKLLWIFMGTLSVLFVYRTVKLFASEFFACLSAAFLLAPNFIWLDNVILTETPFMLMFILCVYFSVRFANDGADRHFFGLSAAFFGALLLRPIAAIFPMIIIPYLLLKGIKFRRLAVSFSIAALVIIITFMAPWSIRNYRLFDEFIPLSYGSGNPLLLGTYQGTGFPKDKELDIKGDVYSQLSSQFKFELEGKGNPHMTKFRSLQYDQMIAKYRLQKWWEKDPMSMIKSYTLIKPRGLLFGTFGYVIFGIPWQIYYPLNNALRILDFSLMIAGIAGILLRRAHRKDTAFVLALLTVWIAVNSCAYAFERYGQTAFFLRFIILGWGCCQLYLWVGKGLKLCCSLRQ